MDFVNIIKGKEGSFTLAKNDMFDRLFVELPNKIDSKIDSLLEIAKDVGKIDFDDDDGDKKLKLCQTAFLNEIARYYFFFSFAKFTLTTATEMLAKTSKEKKNLKSLIKTYRKMTGGNTHGLKFLLLVMFTFIAVSKSLFVNMKSLPQIKIIKDKLYDYESDVCSNIQKNKFGTPQMVGVIEKFFEDTSNTINKHLNLTSGRNFKFEAKYTCENHLINIHFGYDNEKSYSIDEISQMTNDSIKNHNCEKNKSNICELPKLIEQFISTIINHDYNESIIEFYKKKGINQSGLFETYGDDPVYNGIYFNDLFKSINELIEKINKEDTTYNEKLKEKYDEATKPQQQQQQKKKDESNAILYVVIPVCLAIFSVVYFSSSKKKDSTSPVQPSPKLLENKSQTQTQTQTQIKTQSESDLMNACKAEINQLPEETKKKLEDCSKQQNLKDFKKCLNNYNYKTMVGNQKSLKNCRKMIDMQGGTKKRLNKKKKLTRKKKTIRR